MKFTIDVDCTPAEARAFLGLPDLTPLHAVWLDRVQALMVDGVAPADVERMMRGWMPDMAPALTAWQRAFFPTGGAGAGEERK